MRTEIGRSRGMLLLFFVLLNLTNFILTENSRVPSNFMGKNVQILKLFPDSWPVIWLRDKFPSARFRSGCHTGQSHLILNSGQTPTPDWYLIKCPPIEKSPSWLLMPASVVTCDGVGWEAWHWTPGSQSPAPTGRARPLKYTLRQYRKILPSFVANRNLDIYNRPAILYNLSPGSIMIWRQATCVRVGDAGEILDRSLIWRWTSSIKFGIS